MGIAPEGTRHSAKQWKSGFMRIALEAGVPVISNAASHAWVDVYVAERGWVSLDPTHNCEQTDEYVRVATGRDYSDVPPTRGVYKGNAKEDLEVKVEVKSLSQ